MELFFLLVFAACVLIAVWYAARWAFHIDARAPKRETVSWWRKGRIDRAFRDIIGREKDEK